MKNKKIIRVGNSQGIILDKILLDLLGWQVGDLINITCRDEQIMIWRSNKNDKD